MKYDSEMNTTELKNESERELRELSFRLESGRNYLMSVKRSELTAEDALEAFGFSRDGLE